MTREAVMTKLARATASLADGQEVVLDGGRYTFRTPESRPVRDWDPAHDLVGALWASRDTDDPSYVVLRNGGRIVQSDGWGTNWHALDALHQTRHAEREYTQPWYWCDGIACGIANL